MLVDRIVATLFKEECARPLLDRIEKVQAAIRHRTREGNEERAAAFRDAP
jgi:hypothetical protein